MKLIPLTYILLLTLPTLGSAAGNIDSTNKYAWSTNAGWVNFSPANGGVTVATDHLEGYAWAENVGWIKLGTYTGGGNHTYGNTSATDYGVNRDAAGNLSGYAWSTNVGWINFKPTNGGVTVNQTTGQFDGYAWSENLGWIHFQNASPAYLVRYTVIPTVVLSVSSNTGTEAATTVVTVTATASPAVTSDQTVTLTVTGVNANDYSLSGTTITIANGQTTGTVTFTIVNDTDVESTETATLTLSNPSAGITLGTPILQTLSIIDNDTAGGTPGNNSGNTGNTSGNPGNTSGNTGNTSGNPSDIAETRNVTPSTPPLPDQLGLFLQVEGHGQVTTDTGLSCQSSDCQTNEAGELKCDSQACTQLEKTASYVTLTPHADTDSVFTSWGGHEDCVDGQVFMNGGRLCIAYFRRLYPLTVTLQGAGQVQGFGWDQQPMGIDCGTECEATYSAGTTVSLQATPATGQEFLGWGGDCEGMQNPLAVEVTQETTCEARFGLRELPPTPSTPPLPVTPEPGDTTTVTPPPVTAETTPVVPGTMETTPAKPETTETVPVVPETTETVTVVPETTETVPVVPETTEPVPVVPETTEPVPVVPEMTETTPVSETPSSAAVPDTAAPVTTSPTTVVLPSAFLSNTSSCAATGSINQICNYAGRTVTQLEVQSYGLVSNGVLTGMLVNTGWVSNFTITLTGKLSGGVVTGYIKNDGVMQDFEFRGASIVGGTLGGTLRNTSQIGGYFQDVTLLAGTKIIGGILKGTIKGDKKSPAVLENVRVKQGSKLSGVKLGQNVKLEKGVVVE